ncbi:MAG TPA: glycosyl hydrolase 53 family protein, partial [Bacteroidales bacterium]|nr:glycosyl hydrolase 53 family protein [Bacteroidales bacterium]
MTKLTNTFLITFIFALMLGCNDTGIVEPTQPNPQPTPTDTTFYRAVDLSFQPEAGDWQTNYYDAAGNLIEVIPFFADHGVNLVRLRLWYAPEDGYCNLSK